MEYYVGVLAATILLIASNAGIFGVSRLTYSMGQYQQLPDRLRRISPRFRTPASRSCSSAPIACIVIIPGQAEFLGTLYAFGAMLSFTIAHVSLIGLRWRLARSKMRKLPGDVEVEHEEAWYRAPFNVRVQRSGRAAVRGARRARDASRLDRRDGALHDDPVRGRRPGWRSGS